MNARVSPLYTFDRAAHLRHDLDALERMLGDTSTLLLPVWRDQNLITQGPTPSLSIIDATDASHWIDLAAELCFVGLIDQRPAFTLDLSNQADPFSRTRLMDAHGYQELKLIGGQLDPVEASIAAFCRAIFHWHRQHRFCGACGDETRPREGGHARYCRNGECGAKHFPRTDPAIIVLVTRGDRCLLGHQRGWPAGMYSTLAGFVEPGETLEQAVIREVKEESGITVIEPRYWRSQPWPFPSSLMLAFHATAIDEEIVVDGAEIEHAAWYSRDELRNPSQQGFFYPPPYSVAGQLIADFLAQDTRPQETP